MKITRTIGIFIIAIITMLTSACTRVPAGWEAAKFNLYGSSKGVDIETVGPGKYWPGWNVEYVLFPTFTQTTTWAKEDDSGSDQSITFQDKEGTQINADIGLSYAVVPGKSNLVFQKWRKGVDEVTDVYLRNMVRDAISTETSKMDVETIYGVGKEDLMNRVTARLRAQVSQYGLNIEKVYWIGAMRLPAPITASINSKIVATQRAQQRENELQTARAQAEIAREEARGNADAALIAAKGRADSNRLLQQSIDDKLIQYTYAQRWNGVLPTVTGGATPFIQLGK